MELPSSSSSSSSPNPQTLPSPSNWEHDVFLSFRDEDTRNNFTDHLYYAMTQMRINVFRDTEKFQRGKSLSPKLLKAIEKSRFAVVVLSTNYATSTRCLDEIAHILECNRHHLRGLKVLPVFHHVTPSEIRMQTGNYGKAFDKHEINFKDNISKVENWREALNYITSFYGWHVTHDRSESEVIQEIVNQILNVLNKILYVPNGELVGMDARIKEIEYRLDLKSNDVLTIGIWGMGGIGKTTLAEEVFKKIRNPFHLTCFVSQVRLQSAVELQQRLCESFLEIGNINIDTVEKGIKLLKKALFKKKVLIILDDVDSFQKIECLAPGGPLGENIWGGGSRLIITTRDRSSLRDFYVQENDIYEVEKLSDEEAFQLLRKEAFSKENPPEEFVALSKSFLQYAGGLPLAHKVLGSYLSRLKVDGWSHILRKLDDDQDEDIFGVLQRSFNGLQDTDKKIFLDIACFFNGEDLIRVKNILKGCGFSSGIGINNLIDKSLIRVEKNKLWMHDLLRCLGWHIVRGESSSPGERSRLLVDNNALKYESRSSWCFKDARNVLMDNTGTAAVEGLFLSLPEREEMALKDDPFLNMRNLRLLKIYNVNFLGVHFRHISRHLRLLEWHECPLQFLPHNFKSVNLVEIKMPNSRIEQLWNEKMSLGMLTLMDLSHCQYLATTPDFSQVPNLERLILQGCKVLSLVHHTIGNLKKLKFLNLEGCTSLVSLPKCISLSSLEIFILSGCSKLEEFPQIVENMDTLSELYLDGTAILEVPVSIQHLKGLILLNLSGCRNLLSLPSILCCSLTSLKFLYLSLCSSMVKLSDNIGCLEHLEELDASNTAIRKVPESIVLLKNLKLLSFHGCSGFTGLELPNKFSGLRSLTTLNLAGCNLAEGAIPDDIGDLVSLQSLDLSENNFVTIPESISKLSELTEISLSMCSKLQSLPHIPSSLRNLNLYGCRMLTNSSSVRMNYSSEKGSSIVNCRKPEQEDDEIFPELYKFRLGNLEEQDDDTLDSDRVYASEGLNWTNIANLDDMMRRKKEMIRDTRQSCLLQNQVGWLGVPEPPSFIVGFDIHLDELKKKLLEDQVLMVLITGHPGSGKTTLANFLCQDNIVKDKFKIIFVNVSKRPNTEVVQEICGTESGEVLGFQSEEVALDRLKLLLNNTGKVPVLLVLDNVWPGNMTGSLLASLKPKKWEMSNYKILVTSRYVLPGFDVEHHVEELNEKDARSLLRNLAGLTISSFIPEDLQRKVVECCKRLPLAIEVVGRSLFGKDIGIWKDRLKAWSSGYSRNEENALGGFTSEIQLRGCLQSSLDALGEEKADIKECFMDLASFPQGRRIPASVLIDMWTVLIDRRAADKDSSCFAKLYELTYWRLANLVITRNEMGEMDDYYGEHYLTQHDVLRELAIHQANEGPSKHWKRLIIDISGKKFPRRWKKHMDQPFEEARLVSISTGGHFLSTWCDIQLPKAKVLVLNFHTKNYGLPEFAEKMEKLKVLIVTNYGFLPAEVSNFSLLGSLSKLKTIRLERISISSITKNPIELRRLQKISFFMCNMGPVFSKDSIKFFEAFPELQEINIDYCSDLVELPADICLLIHLKKLSITNCHKLSALPAMIGELVNLELLRLRSCTDLSEFPGSVRKLKKLKVLDISNCYSVKELPEYIGEMCSLENLNMRQCLRLGELPESILDLEKLTDVICDEETERLWQPHLPSLRNNIKITVVKEKFSLDWLHQ